MELPVFLLQVKLNLIQSAAILTLIELSLISLASASTRLPLRKL